jgi:hypothetical protein
MKIPLRFAWQGLNKFLWRAGSKVVWLESLLY